MSKKASLRELMGKAGDKGSKLSLRDLPDLLGDGLPELDHSPVGRLRLISALRQRFGDNFRTLPGLKGLMQEFDDSAQAEVIRQKMRNIKIKRGENG